jgi:hypothetical protein
MYKRFIMLLGLFLGSCAPAAAQTPAPQIVLAQEHFAPAITMIRTVSTPSPTASFLPYRDPGISPANFNRLFAGANERDHSLERLPPMEASKTFFFTQSNLPLVQLWSGRLQLDAFQHTLYIQNVQVGPLGYGGMVDFRRLHQSFPGGLRSIHFSGFSLNFYFGRGARTGRPAQAWRRLSRIVGTVLD